MPVTAIFIVFSLAITMTATVITSDFNRALKVRYHNCVAVAVSINSLSFALFLWLLLLGLPCLFVRLCRLKMPPPRAKEKHNRRGRDILTTGSGGV